MERRKSLLLFFLSSLLAVLAGSAIAKSTIEPCSTTDSCRALLGYSLYADLKVAEVAALFQVDPVALLAANAIDFSLPDVDNSILPAGLFLRVPTACSCSGGIRRSVSTSYTLRPADTLDSVAASVFSGLTSADQIRDVNGIQDPSALDAGSTLVVPLPCTCFNSTDNFLPAVYLSYVVLKGDSVAAVAARYSTTVTDIMNVNSMGDPSIHPGDILAIPLPACASTFQQFANDSGLLVANGSYAITAGHCIQCSCGPGNLNLYCTPSSLAASCSSMQCGGNSNLIIGNFTSQQTNSGCSVTSCNYGGFVNGSIFASLTTALQPQCPGRHQLPPVIPPPTTTLHASYFGPSPSPAEAGGRIPSSSVPGTPHAFLGAAPAAGPAGSTSEACFASPWSHMFCILTISLSFFFKIYNNLI